MQGDADSRPPAPPRESGRSPKVLVVDDDDESRDLLSSWLTMEGFEVLTAADGRSALDALAERLPDVVLLDLLMPPPEGKDVLRAIKQRPATADLPVIVMTIKRDLENKIQCLNNGADAFIGKPFQFDELDAVLRSCLRKQRRSNHAYEQAIHRLKEANEKLARLIVTDHRTGLFNERHLKKRLKEELEVSQRYGADLSVMLLDLDHFKRINDTFGHDCGDLVLEQFARLLSENARAIDIVGRFGGEEFLMILRNTDAIRAAIVGERIRRSAEDKVYTYRDKQLKVTVSAGIASIPTNNAVKTDDGLLKAADEALLRAKAATRNKVIVDPASLPRAIVEGDLSAIFQASYEDGMVRRTEPRKRAAVVKPSRQPPTEETSH